jgi:hypothetical protein
MTVPYEKIRKLVLWALANQDTFYQIAADAKEVWAKVKKVYDTMPELFQGECLDEDECLAALEIDPTLLTVASPDPETYGAIDGSRIRKIFQVIKDNPELVKILVSLLVL